MLYHLLVPLAKLFGPLNVFRYVTFRTAGAFLTALLVTLLLLGRLLQWAVCCREIWDRPPDHAWHVVEGALWGIVVLLVSLHYRAL